MDASLMKWQEKHTLATSQQRHLSRENYCLQLMPRVRAKKNLKQRRLPAFENMLFFYFFLSFFFFFGQFICRKTSASIHTITLYISIITAEKIFTLSSCLRNNMVEREGVKGGRERERCSYTYRHTHTHTHFGNMIEPHNRLNGTLF